jgi:drug/metabolite transporter (DMT)-like permease
MSKTLKYAFLVFCGGACYGVMVPLVRSAYTLGFTTSQVMAVQYTLGVLVLGIASLIFSRHRLTIKQALQLLGLGIVAAGVSFGYYHALALLSSAAAITLLFQFAWMGVLLQAVLERRPPNRMTLIAVLLVVAGTFPAAGILEGTGGTLDPLGVFFGLLSAVFYTAFLHLSSRVATDLPTVNRTFFTAAGSLVATICITPTLFSGLSLNLDFIWVAIPLALIGIVAPIFLIQKGAPHLPGSITTIMAASELPSGILMGVAFIGDPISLLTVIGVVVILAGIVLSQYDELRLAFRRKTTSSIDVE